MESWHVSSFICFIIFSCTYKEKPHVLRDKELKLVIHILKNGTRMNNCESIVWAHQKSRNVELRLNCSTCSLCILLFRRQLLKEITLVPFDCPYCPKNPDSWISSQDERSCKSQWKMFCSSLLWMHLGCYWWLIFSWQMSRKWAHRQKTSSYNPWSLPGFRYIQHEHVGGRLCTGNTLICERWLTFQTTEMHLVTGGRSLGVVRGFYAYYVCCFADTLS